MRVGIVGASGFAGGELIRLLTFHPEVELTYVTSRSYAGKLVSTLHPNLAGQTRLKFQGYTPDQAQAQCDLIFLAVPHKAAQNLVPGLLEVGLKVVDLSADFRLRAQRDYEQYYCPHKCPDLLAKAVYGMPELHKAEIRGADLVANIGCHAGAAIYGLAPLAKEGALPTQPIIVDSKTGSSGSGASVNESTHHPLRSGSIRPYKLVNHRHTAEIEQELSALLPGSASRQVQVGFSAHGINIVRGIASSIHLVYTLDEDQFARIDDRFLFKTFRKFYGDAPFLRVVKRSAGVFRLPDPKLIAGTNYCDVGFEIDPHLPRLVVVTALDNLIKGAAGNAVQCMNLMAGFDETTGLTFPGLYP